MKMRALALACMLWSLPVLASAQDTEDPTAGRATAFRAVSGPTTEDVPGGPLLISAYGAILVLMIGYVMWLARLQSITTRDLEALKRALENQTEKR